MHSMSSGVTRDPLTWYEDDGSGSVGVPTSAGLGGWVSKDDLAEVGVGPLEREFHEETGGIFNSVRDGGGVLSVDSTQKKKERKMKE